MQTSANIKTPETVSHPAVQITPETLIKLSVVSTATINPFPRKEQYKVAEREDGRNEWSAEQDDGDVSGPINPRPRTLTSKLD